MHHGFSFAPGPDPGHLVLEYFAEFDRDDARALGKTTLQVPFHLLNLRAIPVQLKSREGIDYSCDTLLEKPIEIPLPKGRDEKSTKWSLGDVLAYTTFSVDQFRQAYVLSRRIAHEIEDAMCLQAALAPCYGIVQTFDVRIAVPREILNFEPFRRSILVRRS